MALTPAEKMKAYRDRLKSVTEAPKTEVESVTEPADGAPAVTVEAVSTLTVTHVSAALLEREARMAGYAGWSATIWIRRLAAMTGEDVPLAEMGGIPIGGRSDVLGPVREGCRQVAVAALDALAARLAALPSDPKDGAPSIRAMLGALIAVETGQRPAVP